MRPLCVLNLGSTSTKIAIFHHKKMVEEITLRHPAEELATFRLIMDQLDYRKEAVESWLKRVGYSLHDFELFVIRGALSQPIESGIYRIHKDMIEDLMVEKYASHATNVGVVIGYNWALETNKEAIFLNSPSTDELNPLARYTGVKGIERRTAFHALNQKQIAIEYATSIHRSVDELKLIVVHLGGGISVGAHSFGRIIDVTNALDGEGPMSPERSGELSVRNAIALYKEMNHDDHAFFKVIAGKGGLVSHTGISDVKVLLEKAKQDPQIQEIIDAMIYQISKEIGKMSVVLEHPIDAILITGGLAYSKEICERITKRVHWIAPVHIYPGEDEMYALAMGAYRYLEKEESLKIF